MEQSKCFRICIALGFCVYLLTEDAMKISKKFNIRKVCLSLSIPTMMLLLLYVMDITDFSTEGEVKLLKYAHMLEIAIRPEEQAVPDDVLFINISYDKELVPVYDEYEMPMGNIDVTDREKLWKLLCAAERNGSYKYILLDIFFKRGTGRNMTRSCSTR